MLGSYGCLPFPTYTQPSPHSVKISCAPTPRLWIPQHTRQRLALVVLASWPALRAILATATHPFTVRQS